MAFLGVKMGKVKFIVFLSLCFLFVLSFHNCAPLTEQGNFKEAGINVFNSESPTTRAKVNDDNNAEEEKKDDGSDNDEENDDPDDEDTETPAEPIGEEFDGSETPEEGGTPVTRGLY